MKHKISKKSVIVTIIILLNLAISPAIHSSIVKNDCNTNYDLLIITPNKFSKILNPLITHKESINISTKLVTLDELYDQMFWHGRDKPEKIKYFIKEAIEKWGIKYVLFVGDFRDIPVRYIYNSFLNNTYTPPEEKFISELYYADIYDQNGNFSSWDTNNNNVYGEWFGETAEDKNIDLYPDVCIGRLACKNRFELNVMVNKIIKYEKTASDSEWFKRIVVVAGDTAPASWNLNWTGNEGEENTLNVIINMSDFEPVKLWTSDGTFKGPWDVIKAINTGCGFLYFEGHANPRSWSAYTPNGTKWVDGLSTSNMNFLFNNEKMPVCVVGGCQSLKFDVRKLFPLTSFKDITDFLVYWPECWGWKLTSKIGGGSIATLGCTGEWMIKEDKESMKGGGDFLNSLFFWEYGVNGTNILGETWSKAVSNYLDEYPINWSTPSGGGFAIDAKTVQDWVLLGDPSLKIGGYS